MWAWLGRGRGHPRGLSVINRHLGGGRCFSTGISLFCPFYSHFSLFFTFIYYYFPREGGRRGGCKQGDPKNGDPCLPSPSPLQELGRPPNGGGRVGNEVNPHNWGTPPPPIGNRETPENGDCFPPPPFTHELGTPEKWGPGGGGGEVITGDPPPKVGIPKEVGTPPPFRSVEVVGSQQELGSHGGLGGGGFGVGP